MKVYPKPLAVILFLLAFISGCSQSPTSVGTKLIPGSNKYTVHDTSLVAVGDTTFKFSQVNGSGSSLLVGNSSSVNATALLLFLATFPDSMATVQIDTAELTLSAAYGWNVPLPPTPAQFEIKEVLSSWSSAVTADSVLNFATTNSPLITITNQDTLHAGKTITTQFDTSLVRKWINIYADTLLPRFFSIALVPRTSNAGIWGFSQFGSSTPPNLEIIYEKNGIKDSISLSIGQGTFFATYSSPLQLSAGIQTQGGTSVYGIVKFNLKPVSDSINKVIVNNATLLLTLKNSQSVIGYGSADSVVAYLAGSATQLDSVGSSYYGYGYRKDTTQTTNSVYTFNVTSMVQQWINTPSGNFGAELRAVDATSTVDKHVFYSSKDSTYAPKLSITYSRK
jgi:hypothetical protein